MSTLGTKGSKLVSLKEIYDGQNISVKLSFIRGFESQDHYYFFKDTKYNYVNALVMHICCFSCSVYLLPFFGIRTLFWRESLLILSLLLRVELTSPLMSLDWICGPDLVNPNVLPCFSPPPHLLRIYSGSGTWTKQRQCTLLSGSGLNLLWRGIEFPLGGLHECNERLDLGWPSEPPLAEEKSETRRRGSWAACFSPLPVQL